MKNMMKKKKEFKMEYLENWPVHYYELDDSGLRLQCINEYLNQHPDSQDDMRRLEIYQHRFGTGLSTQDKYYYAWVMLKSVSQSTVIFNRSHREKDIRKYMIDLGVLSAKTDQFQKQEWENFAVSFIRYALKGSSYGSMLMGLGKVSERDKAFRIANDIRTVTISLPREICLEKEAQPLYDIFAKAFAEAVEDGEDILRLAR